MRQHMLGICIGLLTFVIGGVSSSSGAYYQGKFEAHVDLLRGRKILRKYGLPHPATTNFQAILQKEYGVESVWVTGDIVDERLRAKTTGYNEVSSAAIEGQYGKGAVESAWQMALVEYQREHESGNLL